MCIGPLRWGAVSGRLRILGLVANGSNLGNTKGVLCSAVQGESRTLPPLCL